MTFKQCCIVLLACLMLSACGGIDPDSPLGQRKAIFKQMLSTSEELSGMLKGRVPFNGPRFAEAAMQLDALAYQPWAHFPQVKDSDKTSATDAVWQQQARFEALARELEAATGALVVASQQQPYSASNLTPAVQKVQDTCSACHKAFRNH